MHTILYRGHSVVISDGSRPLPKDKTEAELLCHTRSKLSILDEDGKPVVEADCHGYATGNEVFSCNCSPLTNLQRYLERNGSRERS